jgi:hypothetical protein
MGDMEHGYWNPDPASDAKRMSLTGADGDLKDVAFTKSSTMDSVGDVMVPMERNPLHQTLH